MISRLFEFVAGQADTMSQTLKIDGDRLWRRLMDMARIGATDKGGCNRQALTDDDKTGRDLFCDWARAAGCTVRIDEMGNIFARRAGTEAAAPSVISGSHLDTQPTGGKFDGVYGVLAALEVIETFNDHSIETVHPVEAVVWTNEEGARFAPAMIGSGVFCGEFDLGFAHATQNAEGATLGGELQRIGYAGAEPCAPFPIKAAFEAHIEQGPILEAQGLTIGVVKGVQGMRWLDVIFEGEPVHAGPTPMDQRKDPLRALHPFVDAMYAIADEYGPDSRVTFGDVSASPGSRNTVPQEVKLAVDIRHPDESILDQMEARMRQAAKDAADEAETPLAIHTVWKSPAVVFDRSCVDAVRSATEEQGLSHIDMVSGAGHDSVYVSRVAPTSMIFVPCRDGISHNEAEHAEPHHLEAGANVLLHAILKQATEANDAGK